MRDNTLPIVAALLGIGALFLFSRKAYGQAYDFGVTVSFPEFAEANDLSIDDQLSYDLYEIVRNHEKVATGEAIEEVADLGYDYYELIRNTEKADNAAIDFSSPEFDYDAYELMRNNEKLIVMDDYAGYQDYIPDYYSVVQTSVNYQPVNMSDQNILAFLDMIAYAEGADYNTMFGGNTFDDYSKHPGVFNRYKLGSRYITSSAAGRYQFLLRTWNTLAARLNLTDFSPENQDKAAIELIREKGALNDVKNGNFYAAIRKVAPIWASLPGAGYNQPEKRLDTLLTVYQARGGSVMTA